VFASRIAESKAKKTLGPNRKQAHEWCALTVQQQRHGVAERVGCFEGAIGNQAMLGRLAQAKLFVGSANDPLEHEADRVAEHVTRAPGSERAISTTAPQLSCKCAAREEETAILRTRPTSQARRAPGVVHAALDTPGQPLDAAARAYFEPRFGADFGGVRVHPEARTATAALQARAFTVAQDIVLAPGQYAPGTPEGQRLLAHELTHVLRQQAAPALAGSVQRKTEPPKVTTFRDCTEATTGEDNPNSKLETARVFARNLVDAAIGALVKHDESEPYRTALARHFIAPTFDQLKVIYGSFQKIQSKLTPENIRCAASDADLDECFHDPEAGVEMAFNKTQTSDTVLCPPFWYTNLPCQAINLIREAAHGIGLGIGAKHPPYHGSAEYPAFKPPPAGESAARIDNPDAYAYFAAHIGRETDTQCRVLADTIKVEDKAPSSGGTHR
jgi:hypothetical protein